MGRGGVAGAMRRGRGIGRFELTADQWVYSKSHPHALLLVGLETLSSNSMVHKLRQGGRFPVHALKCQVSIALLAPFAPAALTLVTKTCSCQLVRSSTGCGPKLAVLSVAYAPALSSNSF